MFDRNTILISSNNDSINFRATGSIIKFEGFLKIYQVQETDEDTKNILPEVKIGEEIKHNDNVIGKILIDKPFPFALIKLFNPEFSTFQHAKLKINNNDVEIISWRL